MDDEKEAEPSYKLLKPLLHIHGAKQTSFNTVYTKKHMIRNIKKEKRYQK